LKWERVDEEVHENNIFFCSSWVSVSYGGPSMCNDKGGINIMKDVGPNFTDTVDLIEGFEIRVAKGVHSTFATKRSIIMLSEGNLAKTHAEVE
jgi:hypothetical protein